MKKYFLLGVIVLFSFNASTYTRSEHYEQQIVDKIPAFFKETLHKYPELKGKFEPNIESIQLSWSVLSRINQAIWADTDWNIGCTLEMDITDTESGDIMKLNCKLRVQYEASTNSFEMYFSKNGGMFEVGNPIAPCSLIHQEEKLFTNPSVNPSYKFQVRSYLKDHSL